MDFAGGGEHRKGGEGGGRKEERRRSRKEKGRKGRGKVAKEGDKQRAVRAVSRGTVPGYALYAL